MTRDEMIAAIAEIIRLAVEGERERCARVIEEGFEKPVGKAFRSDGKPSKNDECPHGRYMYEDCDACCAAAIRRPD